MARPSGPNPTTSRGDLFRVRRRSLSAGRTSGSSSGRGREAVTLFPLEGGPRSSLLPHAEATRSSTEQAPPFPVRGSARWGKLAGGGAGLLPLGVRLSDPEALPLGIRSWCSAVQRGSRAVVSASFPGRALRPVSVPSYLAAVPSEGAVRRGGLPRAWYPQTLILKRSFARSPQDLCPRPPYPPVRTGE